jgi:hypothetical protein
MGRRRGGVRPAGPQIRPSSGADVADVCHPLLWPAVAAGEGGSAAASRPLLVAY